MAHSLLLEISQGAAEVVPRPCEAVRDASLDLALEHLEQDLARTQRLLRKALDRVESELADADAKAKDRIE